MVAVKYDEKFWMDLKEGMRAFPLKDYLVQNGFSELSLNEWVTTCPKCFKENKLCVEAEKRVFHCWVCGVFEYRTTRDGRRKRRAKSGAGNLVRLIQWLEGCSFTVAAQKVLRYGHFDPIPLHFIPELVLEFDEEEDVESKLVAIPPPEGSQPIFTSIPYLERRRISMDDVRTFGLFQVTSGLYRNRLVFPVWQDGQLVYWQARAMWEAEDRPGERYTKCLNPPKTEGALGSSDVLMNIDLASKFSRVAIVEGPVDCVHTGPDAVCSFGKRLSTRQVWLLYERGVREIDFMWDGPKEKEPEGTLADMLEASRIMTHLFRVRVVHLPGGDPGDYSREELLRFRAEALPIEHFNLPSYIP